MLRITVLLALGSLLSGCGGEFVMLDTPDKVRHYCEKECTSYGGELVGVIVSAGEMQGCQCKY